ncbi:hypothetical protein IV102_14730 [bacterium]|nr:hypothetical protein [bacterium]
MKTLEECQQFLDRVGIATVLPGKLALFPCLLWQAQGHRGPFTGADVAFHNIWTWKDELPARRLAFAGRLLGDQVLLVHTRLLPALLGYRGRLDVADLYADGELSRHAFRLWEILQKGPRPVGRKELRLALGLTDKGGSAHFDRACRDLERLLLITRAGSAPQGSGWDSNAYALLDRHFDGIEPLPRKSSAALVKEALCEAAPQASSLHLQRWMARLG